MTENLYVPNRFRPDLQKTPKNILERVRFFAFGGNQFWETTEDLIVNVVMQDGALETFVVPAFFTHDFASIPKFLWGIIAPWGRHGPAAILHDALYRGEIKIKTRKEADVVFLQVMKKVDTGLLRRQIMYRMVRLFGGFNTKAW